MGKVAVTGGAGFVGTNLVQELVRQGYEVVVIDDFSSGLESNLYGFPCEVFHASITESNHLRLALRNCDYIFHLAARGSVPRSIRNPRATFEVNAIGTFNVLECARESGAKVAFASSSSVYGANRALPKNEEMWTSPLTPYAASKLSGEALAQSYSSSFGMTVVNYRFFNIFGPWQRPDHHYAAVIPKWIWQLMSGGDLIEVFGDGTHSRDFTYIDTVVSTLIRGMQENLNHPAPINLALGRKISLNDVAEELRSYFPKLTILQKEPREGDIRESQNDPTKLLRVFPGIQSREFTEEIKETVSWFAKYAHKIINGPNVLN